VVSFDDLEHRMRPHDTAGDRRGSPDAVLVARLDVRGFTRLLRRRPELERPLDLQIRDIMIATADHLMRCGPEVDHGHTQSDEISLLLHRSESGRPLAALIALLVGEATAKLTHLLGEPACFDCRIAELPDLAAAADYLRWRLVVGAREALHAHCEAALRDAGEAGDRLQGLDHAGQQALLRDLGVNFAALPAWHRGGAGLLWGRSDVDPINPRTGEVMHALRRRLRVELELPTGEAYAELVRAYDRGQPAA
jgi:tRNA(His) guanylyltransferase